MPDMASLRGWMPATAAERYDVIDMHTGGEPLRVIVAGLPELPGANVLEKRRWFAENLDHVRTALMWEPRGHADMYGAVVTPAADGADFDIFFLHNEGYSTMCGHAVIALARLVVESGLVPPGRCEIAFNAPCGRIAARAELNGGSVATSFRNVPSFVALADAAVDVPGLGGVRFDVAYGGAYYAIVEAGPLGLTLDAADHDRLIDSGRRIKSAVQASFPVVHPAEPDLSFLYGTIFTGPARDASHHSRNVCIFADGEVDRSATGSGVSARAALHHARGELAAGETIRIESIIGSTMDVRVAEEVDFAGTKAIVPEVAGTAYYTGRSSFWIEPGDPLADGFLLR